MSLTRHMREKDIEVFKKAAQRYRVYILVRRTNVASMQYFEKDGYVAKRLDCKAKTAQYNVPLARHGIKQTAGLVVDPTIDGFIAAFDPDKYAVAREEWEKFAHKLPPEPVTGPGSRDLTYFPGLGFYAVQRDPAHPHYGCVMFASNSLISAARYVHGDYDLYDIVPLASPAHNRITVDKAHGEAHHRGPHLFDVQHFVNRHSGIPAVLHGSQAKFKTEHTHEGIDVFYPDGMTVVPCDGKKAIERLYLTEFKGRKLFQAA